MNFVAMVFETASPKRYSACSLALTIVRNNQVADEFYSLIKPDTEFNWRNVQIHGIHEEDVVDAPSFPEIWQVINPFFQTNQLIVAHNAPFDNGVLKSCLEHYELQRTHYLNLDTVRSSRKFFPEFENHKLDTVCTHLGIELNHHHNALDDSLACANILLYEANNFGAEQLKPFVRMIN